MAFYKKKPVVIEAMRLPSEGITASDELISFLHQMDEKWESEKDGSIIIHTLEGDHLALPGDFIIKGVASEYYPCKPDIFEKTYERVSD